MSIAKSFLEEFAKIASTPGGPEKPPVYEEIAKRLPELTKKTKVGFSMQPIKSGLHNVAEHLHKHEDAYELGGLGVLGAIGADRLQAHARAHKQGLYDEKSIEHHQALGETGHAVLDTAGLGMLAAPIVAKKMLGK